MRRTSLDWFGLVVFACTVSIAYLQPAVGDEPDKATATEKAAKSDGATDSKKEAPRFMPLGSPDKAKSAKLGGPDKKGKPRFALKNTTPFAVAGNGRAAEVKRLITTYHNLAIRYVEDLAKVTDDEEQAKLAKRQPSIKSLRPFVTLLAHKIADDPKDEPSLDALVFVSKFVGLPEIDEALAKVAEEVSDDSPVELDPRGLLLEHHADNKRIIDACRRMPRGEETDDFLHALFEKTYNPHVRWSAAAQLISSLRRNDRLDEIEPIAIEMSEDRYLEGVPVAKTNAREWAIAKLREIRTLGIGNPLPEVSGTTLDGKSATISDYRGRVVVLDVWATWCGPCVKMIPHQTEMVEHLKDEPFTILSVSCDGEMETLEEFIKDKPMPWDHWWVGQDTEFTKLLNIGAYPTIYVIDGKGVIRHKNLKGEELEEAVNELLEEMEQ